MAGIMNMAKLKLSKSSIILCSGFIPIYSLFNYSTYLQNKTFHLFFRVPSFEGTKFLVTNKEFLAFVKDKGYQRRELWTDEGNWGGGGGGGGV